MNAVIGLCHFCELHGPSLVFCTQSFHSPDSCLFPNVQGSSYDDSYLALSLRGGSAGLQRSLSSGSTSSRADETRSLRMRNNDDSTSSAPSVSHLKSTSCESCRSFSSGHPGLFSNDLEAKVCYISCQQPSHPQVYSMLRQACVRSLSIEVCPGREGPIFFGDDHRGHVLSYTFHLHDTCARGLSRSYSVVVVMNDKIFLLNSWPFLVKHIKIIEGFSCRHFACRHFPVTSVNSRSVIGDLQGKAARVYEHEQRSCPQRAARLKQLRGMTPANFRQQRAASKQARSLPELTADQKIFKKLHLAFTWILKAGGTRLTEKLLEGPPTEDSMVDFEKQIETEEGFVMLVAKKVDPPKPEVSHHSNALTEEEEEEDVGAQFASLRHLFKTVGSQRFHTLAHHVIVGNQLIVRGQSRATVRSVIDILQALLPKGCRRVINYSDKYEDTWRCNFLGLAPGTPIPRHVSLFVTLDIIEPEITEQMLNSPAQPLRLTNENDFVGYTFLTSSPVELPEKCPVVLSRMEYTLRNSELADSVVEQCLVCLKEEWMNKVKVLFKFTRAGGQRSEDDKRKLYTVVGAGPEDRPVLKFWMTGLSVQYKNDMLKAAKT